jgi:uncharacterized membrane protein YgdD (TMEM256/DUF423 family)
VGRKFLVLGSLLAFLSVALGAFGAHALKTRLEPKDLEIFQTGVHYQGFHALALLLAASLLYFKPELAKLKTVCWFFTVGILIFSGTLYALSMTGVKWLGAITPIGGVCFLSGWLMLTVVAASLPESRRS